MSVALHGNLRDFGIAEVFQLIGQQRKTGMLIVGEGDDAIFLAFDAGRVVRGGPMGTRGDREPLGPQLVRSGYLTRDQLANLHSESERSARPLAGLLLASGLIEEGTLDEVQHVLTKETVFDVMRRQSGNFRFTAEPVVHETKPENLLGAEQILMDGLRMLDEWQTFSSIVPSEDLVFRRVGDFESAIALTKGDPQGRLGNAERILQLVDGRLNVRRVIDLSRLGTFEATRALAELRQAGVIDVATVADRKRDRNLREKARRPLLPILRAALATVLPFLLLGWIAVSSPTKGDATGGLPGTAIPERAISQLGGRHEADRIRQIVEVHRFETGRYPAELSEVASRTASSGHSLTPEQLADYYYAVRDDEVVLLAPMR